MIVFSRIETPRPCTFVRISPLTSNRSVRSWHKGILFAHQCDRTKEFCNRCRDCDLWIAVKNKFFTPTCTKVFIALSERWNVFPPPHVALAPRVMRQMSENFSEKVFWDCRIKFCNEQKIFFEQKIFCWTETFYEKVFCSRRKKFLRSRKVLWKTFLKLGVANFSCATKNFCCGKWIEFTIADIVKRLQQLANEAGAQRRMRNRQKALSLDTCGPNSESWGRQFVKDAALVHECDRIDRSSELFWKSSSANRGAAHFFSKGLAKNVRFAFREFMNS